MKAPKIRFTIRGIMAAIAVITVIGVGAVETMRLMREREICLFAADYHGQRVQEERKKVEDIASARSRGLVTDPIVAIIEDLARSKAEFHDRMRRKWEFAAAHPWQTTEEDPLEPTDARIERELTELPTAKPFPTDQLPKLLAIDPPPK